MTRTGPLAGGLLLVLGLGAGAAFVTASPDAREPAFRTAAIDVGPIAQVVTTNGTLRPITVVTVGAEVSGTVVERTVDFNDRVTKGQVLLRLNPSNFEARVRQASAQLAAGEARAAFAASSHERNVLLANHGFIAAPQQEQSRRELDAARAEVDVFRAQLDAARADLSNSVIRAPIDGVVVKRSIDVGQTVAASFQTPELFLIAQDLSAMVIHADVAEADIGWVRSGQRVQFSVDAFPLREFEGVVRTLRLDSTQAQGVVSYTVVVEVDNGNGMLKPGMTAQARIVVAAKDRALRVPTAALRFKAHEDELAARPADTARADDGALHETREGRRILSIYTVDAEQRLHAHAVSTGLANNRYTELIGGPLPEGTGVVVRRRTSGSKAGP